MPELESRTKFSSLGSEAAELWLILKVNPQYWIILCYYRNFAFYIAHFFRILVVRERFYIHAVCKVGRIRSRGWVSFRDMEIF